MLSYSRGACRACVWGVLGLLLASALSCWADDLRLERERMRNMLKVVSSDIEKNFYDPQLKGLDWKALTEQAKQKIDNAKSVSEMVTAIFVLVEKLQDSHTKFDPPARAVRPLFGFEAKAFGDEIRVFIVRGGSAADVAGLKVGDRILRVNGYTAERNTFDLMMLDMRRLRPIGQMRIEIQRGNEPPQVVTVVAKMKQQAVHQDLVNDESRTGDIWQDIMEGADEGEYFFSKNWDGVAYLSIPSFMHEDVSGLTDRLQNAKAIILDLRDNPGGILDTMLASAGSFEAADTTMGDNITRKKTEPLNIKRRKPNYSVPLFLLVDSRSASAAEMFARHFQKAGKAVVIGDRTSGRVNASKYFIGQTGSDSVVLFGAQISVGRIVFPGGEELERIGVTPDVPCLPSGADVSEFRDPCLLRAVSMARKKLGMSEEVPGKQIAEINGITASRNQIEAEKKP